MDIIDYIKAVLRGWWILLLCCLIGVAGGVYRNHSTTPVYSSSVTFYVGTPTNSSSAFTDDQFAQSRAISYSELLSSERLAALVVASSHIKLTPGQVMGKIHGSVPLNTVLVTATVNDTSAARALLIANAVAKQFGPLVSSLDNTGKTPTVNLSVVSGPRGGAAPIAPRPKVNLVLGLLLGLVVGLFGALVLDVKRRRKRPHSSSRPHGAAQAMSSTDSPVLRTGPSTLARK